MFRFASASYFLSLLLVVGPVLGDEIRLGIPVVVNRPLMVELDSSLEGYVEINAPGFEWNDDWSYTEDTHFIDEYQQFGKGTEKATRQYIWEKLKLNGHFADTALNGVFAEFEYKGKEDGWSVQLRRNRALSGRLFDRLMDRTGTLGVWLEFPDKVKLGEVLKLDLGLLTPLFIDVESEMKSSASLLVRSHDPETGIVTLEGTASFRGAVALAETPVRMSSSGTLTLEVDVPGQRIAKATYDGTVKLAGNKNVEVKGEAAHKVTIATSADKRKVERHRKKKPRYRDRKIIVNRLGVGVKLPSHWTQLSSDGDERRFVRTVDFDKGTATIDLKMLDADSGYQPGLFLDQLYAALLRDYPGLKYRKTKSPLGTGQGRVYYLPTSKSISDGDIVQIEVYPHRGKFLMFRLYGPAAAYNAATREFQKAKSTLGVLNPKRSR